MARLACCSPWRSPYVHTGRHWECTCAPPPLPFCVGPRDQSQDLVFGRQAHHQPSYLLRLFPFHVTVSLCMLGTCWTRCLLLPLLNFKARSQQVIQSGFEQEACATSRSTKKASNLQPTPGACNSSPTLACPSVTAAVNAVCRQIYNGSLWLCGSYP